MKFYSFLFIFISLISSAHARWTVSAYNIRNFDRDPDSGKTNVQELTKIIREARSDVMAFEEIVNQTAFQSLMANALPGYDFKLSSCGGFGKQKIALAYNQSVFEFVSIVEDFSFSGKPNACGSLRPLLLVTLKHKKLGFLTTFGVVHLKAGGNSAAYQKRWQQYELLSKLSESFKNKNLVLLGDFNTTGFNIKDEDYTKFEDFLSGSKLRTLSETLGCTSYWEGAPNDGVHDPSILDHIVIQDKNMGAVEQVRTIAHCAKLSCRQATPADLGTSYNSVSDHCPVQVSFK